LRVDAPSSLIDVGGGSSALVDALVAQGWRDLSVLDVSPVAIGAAQARLGPSPVQWQVSDVLHWWPKRQYDIWHDRAVFHFLTDEHDRELYRCRLAAAVRPGGYAIVATFALDGPETCSALPVSRYDGPALAAAAAPSFARVAERRQVHRTPTGAEQPFTWVVLRAPDGEGEALDSYMAEAREQIDRVLPAGLAGEVAAGALVVDFRPVEQRDREGALPGAVVVDRNVLEWRTVWSSPHRLEQITGPGQRIILVCNEGYASSVAAATLRRLGMHRATDLAGGFQAWQRHQRRSAERG
jgi:rhodanese-related sulfurtransferase